MEIRECLECRKPFETTKANFCSKKCRDRYAYKAKLEAKRKDLPDVEEILDKSLDEKIAWIKRQNAAGNKVTYADIQRASTMRMLKGQSVDPIETLPLYSEDILLSNLSYLIDESGLNATRIALDLGMTPTVFKGICFGTKTLRVKDLIQISEYFGVRIDKLLSEDLNE